MQLPCAGKIEYCYRVVREGVDIYSSLLEPRKGRDFHCAALKLRLSTPEAIVTERRILNSLFTKLEEWEGNKGQVLKYLLCLIRKSYEELTKRTLSQSIILSLIDYMCAGAAEGGCSEEHDATLRSNLNDLSLKGMYDPGIISTGHNFKRMWFQKWLHEGMI
ncbi:unnamed protein product, partial [Brassica oleracea var. botrytis]